MRTYYYRKRARSGTDLRTAIEWGDYAAVKQAIGQYPCLMHCPTGRTADLPVHVAARVGNRRIVKLLLQMGADPNSRNAHRRTPAHLSVLHHKYHVVKLLFDDRADQAAVDCSNNTALDLATIMNEKRCLNILLDCKIPKNVLNNAFYKSVSRNNTILMNKLLNHGADINYQNEFTGYTALLAAIKRKQIKTIKFLLEKGADPSAYDCTNGWTCLHYAVQYSFSEFVMTMILENMSLLGNLQQTLKSRTFGAQETALHLAVRRGNETAMFALLHAGSPLEAVDYQGRTPLLSAIHNYQDMLAVFLVCAGANLNLEPGFQAIMTPLQAAIARRGPGDLSLVRCFLECGAYVVDPRYGDLDRTIIHMVCESGDVDILKCLLLYMKKDMLNALHGPGRLRPPIVLAASKGHGATVDMLLAHGANVNAHACGSCGETALHAAVKAGNAALVDRLLNAGACTDARDFSGAGRRPVEVAIYMHGHGSAVTAHLIHSDRLAKAVIRDDIDTVAFLLACGVTPNATTRTYSGTPLHVAVRYKRYRMAAVILLSDRCRTTVRYNGVTVLDQALAMGDMRSVDMMVGHSLTVSADIANAQ